MKLIISVSARYILCTKSPSTGQRADPASLPLSRHHMSRLGFSFLRRHFHVVSLAWRQINEVCIRLFGTVTFCLTQLSYFVSTVLSLYTRLHTETGDQVLAMIFSIFALKLDV